MTGAHSLPLMDRDGRLHPRKRGQRSKLQNWLFKRGAGLMGDGEPSLRLASHLADPDATTAPASMAAWCRDLVWGRRTITGAQLDDKAFRKQMWHHAWLMLVALPPLGILVMIANVIGGPKPRLTRASFLFTCAFWLLIVVQSQSMLGQMGRQGLIDTGPQQTMSWTEFLKASLSGQTVDLMARPPERDRAGTRGDVATLYALRLPATDLPATDLPAGFDRIDSLR